jgi:hypothetical protein
MKKEVTKQTIDKLKREKLKAIKTNEIVKK